MKSHSQFDLIAVHAGKDEIDVVTRPEVPPIYQTSVFTFKDIDQVDEVLTNNKGYIYSRYNNPNREMLAQTLAELAQAERAVTTASGMGAIAAALLASVKAGETVLASNEVYGGTYTLLTRDLPDLGINVKFVDVLDHDQVKQHLSSEVKVLYLETITNPTMKVADLELLISLAHQYDAKVIVDNTFASPYVCQPISLGADVVVHSLTKYINGHSDVTAGVVLSDKQFCEIVNEKVKSYGASLAPFDAWLVLRGIKTLSLRMERTCENALNIAQWLEHQPPVGNINYPGLTRHPAHSIAQKQFNRGFGGMLSFEIKGGLAAANSFIRNLKLVEYVPSLAGVATTLLHPVSTSHRPMPEAKRLELGITDGLIRLSVGIEPLEEILYDLTQALHRITIE